MDEKHIYMNNFVTKTPKIKGNESTNGTTASSISKSEITDNTLLNRFRNDLLYSLNIIIITIRDVFKMGPMGRCITKIYFRTFNSTPAGLVGRINLILVLKKKNMGYTSRTINIYGTVLFFFLTNFLFAFL